MIRQELKVRRSEKKEEETAWITEEITRQKKIQEEKKYASMQEALREKWREDKRRQRENRKLQQLEEERQEKLNRKRKIEKHREIQEKIKQLKDNKNKKQSYNKNQQENNFEKERTTSNGKSNSSFGSEDISHTNQPSTSKQLIPIVCIEKITTPVKLRKSISPKELLGGRVQQSPAKPQLQVQADEGSETRKVAAGRSKRTDVLGRGASVGSRVRIDNGIG